LNHGYPASALAQAIGVPEGEAANVYKDIVAKRKMTQPLHTHLHLARPIPEI
jgi:hypothetical protein